MSELAARRTALADAPVMIGRCLRLSARNGEALLMSLMLPVILMLVFVHLFGGAIETGTEYVTYVVPGVIVLCVGFGAAQTAVGVSRDMNEGIVDRFRSMDVGGPAILTGHVTASVARNLVSTALVLAIALLIGFRPAASAPQWLAAIGVLVAFALAVSWPCAAVGLLTRTAEGASGFTFFMTFLPYTSSAFVPIDTMPTWLQGFARNQPVTPVIESLRGLLLDQPVGTAPALALAWCGGLVAVSIALSALAFRHRTG